MYTHIFYALGGSEMPNGQNLRPIADGLPAWWGGLSRGISRKGQALRANLGGEHPLEPRESSWNE